MINLGLMRLITEVLMSALVECQMPEPEDPDDPGEPPEEYGAWFQPEGCRHLYCLEADDARRTYNGAVAAGWTNDHPKESPAREWEEAM